MNKRLEDFMKANRDEFDELEPRMALWDKIESKLPVEEVPLPKKQEARTFSLGFVLRVAAITVIVMGISFMYYLKIQPQKIDLAKINPEDAKQQVHYASLVQTKRTELKELTKADPELYKEFSAEIAKMDSTYKKLNSDLLTSPNQERVLRAMIRNLQIQTEVLNQQLNVIGQFNDYKKQQKNETKNI